MADYDIGKAFERIENELISSMMRNLKHHRAEETKEGIQWSQWQTEQLKALEAYKKENKKRFSPQFAKINQKIPEAIKAAYSQGGMEQEVKILKALQKGYTGYARKFDGTTDIEGSFFKVNERKLNSLINSTVNDMKKAEHAVLRMSDDKYRKIIFDAQVYANAGGTTYEKAVDMATRDFLSAGINCIEYKNGARHTISDYADMAIRTANKRAYLRGEGTKRAEWGIHTVIVNKRGNPCPLCAPFCGMVLIDDVYSGGSAKDGDYPLISTAMAAGFLHPRCQDIFSTYFEGISTPPDKEQLTREESEQLAEKAKQKQRKDYAENQSKRMNRLAKHSLDEDNKKMYSQRAEKWQEKAEEIEEKLSVPVANSGESGIIKEQSKKTITQITDSAIKHIPRIDITGYTEEQCIEIQKQHKELLEYARKHNDSKEVAFVFRKDLSDRTEFLGQYDKVDFGTGLLGKGNDLIVMHNHPRNSSYSTTDLMLFRDYNNVKTLTIVKNNGSVEYITKSKDYDNKKFMLEYDRLYRKIVINGTDSENDRFVKTLLNKTKSGVIWSERK